MDPGFCRTADPGMWERSGIGSSLVPKAQPGKFQGPEEPKIPGIGEKGGKSLIPKGLEHPKSHPEHSQVFRLQSQWDLG